MDGKVIGGVSGDPDVADGAATLSLRWPRWSLRWTRWAVSPPSMTDMTHLHGSSRAPHDDPRLRILAEESGYEVLGRIGAGGMGIVHRALDADGRDVAIKLLRPEIADDPRARERLAREVASQQRVRHHGIARIVDAELDSSVAFVATEFVAGPTLEDAVRAHGGLHPEAVREIGLALGETLRDIHAAGIIHRDLKPSNVMLRDAREGDLVAYDPDGAGLDPVIIDFGIAQAAEESRLTSTGLVMGTAAYLDPEVMRTNSTDAASDWWSWATLLAFAATGREPFGSGRADVVFFRTQRGELDVAGLPTELASWLRDALRADPAQRLDPEVLLARLEDVDLDRWGDPDDGRDVSAAGVADAGAATEVLAPVPSGDALFYDAPFDGRSDATTVDAPTEVLGRGSFDDLPEGATEVISAGAGATRALPVMGAGPATEVLGAIGDPADPTEALPAVDPPWVHPDERRFPDATSRTEQRTEAIDPWEATEPHAAAEPRTEVLRPIGAPTRALPVIPESAANPKPAAQAHHVQPLPQVARPQVPMGAQSQPYGASQPYGTPQPQPQPSVSHQGSPYGAAHPAQRYAAPYALPPRPPRRRLLVWIGHAVLIALAAVVPYVALALMIVLGAVARTWERSHRSAQAALARGRSSASLGIGIAAPFRALLGVLELVLMALFPLVLGLLLAVCADALMVYGLQQTLPSGVLFAGAMAVTLLLTWVGIGGRTTRDGAHRMLDAAAPDAVWGAVIAGLVLLLLGAVAAAIAARGGQIDYFPFISGPRLEDLLPWRR